MKFFAPTHAPGPGPSGIDISSRQFSSPIKWNQRRQQLVRLKTWFLTLPGFVKNGLCIVTFMLVVEGAQFSATGYLTFQHLKKGPVYGPSFPEQLYPKEFMSFSQAGHPFLLGHPLWRIDEIPRQQLEDMIVSSTPRNLRGGLKKYMDLGLDYAQKYQLDPFWVLSVMWVESHFNPRSRSPVNATGLMQIMPATSAYLNYLLDRDLDDKLAHELTKDPDHNIQLGTFYLKRLLKAFRGNYVHATVAYNMGPGYTRRRLRLRLPVGKRNLYLDKVRRAYKSLSRHTLRYLENNSPDFSQTLVVKRTFPHEWRPLDGGEWLEYREDFQEFMTFLQVPSNNEG